MRYSIYSLMDVPPEESYCPPGTCFIPVGAAILGGAGISGISSLIGGGKGASAATQAASIQAGAANNAIDFQRGVLTQIQGIVQPYLDAGQSALGTLTGAIPGLTSGYQAPTVPDAIYTSLWSPPVEATQQIPTIGGVPPPPGGVETPIDTTTIPAFTGGPPPTWDPTMAGLEQTPGYQFALQEGELATQGASAAAGLGRGGVSTGSAIKYAQGLASTTYQQQFGDFENQFQNYEQVYGNYLSGVQNIFAARSQTLNQNAQLYNMYGQDVQNLFTSNEQQLAQKAQLYNIYQGNVNDVLQARQQTLAQNNQLFNEQLASQTQQMQNKAQTYSMLYGPVNTAGQFLSAGLGGSTPITSGIASNITGAGAAQAAGVVGASNALTSGLTGVGNAATSAAGQYAQLQYLQSLNPATANMNSAQNAFTSAGNSGLYTDPASTTSASANPAANPLAYFYGAGGGGGSPYGTPSSGGQSYGGY